MIASEPRRPKAPAPQESPLPFLDIKLQYQALRDEVLDAIREVTDSTGFILGPKVEAFEREFAAFSGVKHCVAVNSGTSALHLALLGAGVGPGDEVITVPMTFIATSWAISYAGATPVFVDVDPTTYTMDPAQVEAKITPKTKALLPVHLYGQPADLGPLRAIAERRGIALIEDCAQAHGARYQGRPVGTFGLASGFSFYPGKNLGAFGEGGAVVTDDDRLAQRFRALRDHAQSERYHHTEIGFNYRMDAIQGAVLGVKLKHLADWNRSRQRLAARYHELLAGLPVVLPQEAPGRQSVWHLFVILHPERDTLRSALASRGVQTGLHYPIPVHLQEAYRSLGYRAGDFPVSERIGRECLSLPLFPEMTDAQQDRVADALREALGEVS